MSEIGLEKAPSGIFNLDKVYVGTNSLAPKVFMPKKSNISYMKSADTGKSMYSVLLCESGATYFRPPFNANKRMYFYESWTKSKATLQGINLPKISCGVKNVSVVTSSYKFDVLKIMTNSRVVVKYAEKRPSKNFIGQITGMEEDDFMVKYVKKSAIGDYLF